MTLLVKRKSVRPGLVLAEKFLKLRHLTPKQLSIHTKVPLEQITDIMDGIQPITVEIAVRFAGALGTTELYWMELQARYDLARSAEQTTAPDRITTPFDNYITDPGY